MEADACSRFLFFFVNERCNRVSAVSVFMVYEKQYPMRCIF